MVTELQSKIHENLSLFLERKVELQEFEDWFMPVLWDLSLGNDEKSRNLAGTINNLIAEYSHGDRSEPSLREELAIVMTTGSLSRSNLH